MTDDPEPTVYDWEEEWECEEGDYTFPKFFEAGFESLVKWLTPYQDFSILHGEVRPQ